MHVLSQSSNQSRLTLLSMLTNFIRKFYKGFHLLLLPKNVHSQNSTNENLWFFLFFYPKMCILKIQQIEIFDFSQSRNVFFQTVPYWLLEYDCVYKKWSFLSHLQAKYVRPLLTNTLLYSMIWCLLYCIGGKSQFSNARITV